MLSQKRVKIKIIKKPVGTKLAFADIEKSKLEIVHRIKNGNIIAKFKDRKPRDLVYKNEMKLKEKNDQRSRIYKGITIIYLGITII